MWYIFTMKYYSNLKKTTVPFAAVLINLEIVILNEVSQTDVKHKLALAIYLYKD